MGEERDLGVKITNDLKASAECAYVCSRANSVGHDQKNHCLQESGGFDWALQELGEAASGVLRVGSVSALCEGSGEAGKSAA